MAKSNLPIFVATDDLIQDLHDLGYTKNIELEDFLDLFEEDPDYIFFVVPALEAHDELAYMTPRLQSILNKYLDRPWQ